MITDLDYGTGMNKVVRYHAAYESSYQYVWSYKSWNDYEPHWMGAFCFVISKYASSSIFSVQLFQSLYPLQTFIHYNTLR